MKVVLDDHLLRDLLADDVTGSLKRLLSAHSPCTTNLYHLRLCKSVVSARGTQLTGSWTQEQRIELGRKLTALDRSIEVVPMHLLAYRMAELAETYRLSSLGAEAVSAAEVLGADLAVWSGDDGMGIRTAAKALRIRYRAVNH